MTAPLNASTLQPAAATGAVTGLFGAASQGPMAGFEALLTAFFGNQGAGEPILGADGKPVSKTAAGAAKEAKTAKDGKAAPRPPTPPRPPPTPRSWPPCWPSPSPRRSPSRPPLSPMMRPPAAARPPPRPLPATSRG
uniref:Uncharacterized protein n=1 Tax=Phenylobacterium glaciei TaxID=2803784 RepID=A0A974P237_9CAUL|nr:hypothetical protein JKL49_21580 [Phenylobacterium glaciei]